MSEDETPAVRIRDLGVDLGGAPVLHGVSLDVAPGELVGLLGANGSGKSTLLRAMVGVQSISAGSVHLFGRPVRERRIRARIGYVPQFSAESGSIPATARETVATGLLGPGRWFSRLRDPRVNSLLADVGLRDQAERPVTQMSGGQRQRVMIARALVRSPQLLVLDEPFSGVDVSTQESIAAIFRRLAQRGTTVVVVLHELGPLSEGIRRAVVLDRGRVVHDGPPEQRPLFDPGHDHSALPEDCLGQEIHP
ncbi:ABC transporter ATP-binding protein [Brachybacterium endophyticum]|uniref:ABC transporter ATP-binding protein n=1 Tax=Brachybacterium endophyticum TaxID=2182385 RepID=A0A2U2RI56_9MICO|nr:metal ABC transporter ATP-binding protein [Brachybacterium endophyticum]PWH05567.1 ABC transporter ATP-binding protein [Brachybacterium endophyticum]